MIRRLGIATALALMALKSFAQFTYGTTGLLRMPTADMNACGTVMAGYNHLSHEATQPRRYGYDSDNYYINATLFSFLEIGYSMILRSEELKHLSYISQDRSVHAKVCLLHEGQFKTWTPQVVIGCNDPLSHTDKGDAGITMGANSVDAHMTRYYLAMSKHFGLKRFGMFGCHVAFIKYDEKLPDANYFRPAIGGDLHIPYTTFHLPKSTLTDLALMAEYDGRTVNVGASATLFRYLSLYGELNRCRYLSAGIQFHIQVYK